MALTLGTRLGVYDITAPIGEGGMGQVYRATDAKLKRQVAIKVLPPSLAVDADRLARFQREAEVLASLNHPNIAAIYGLEDSGGVTALVMELVEGDDLSQRIARGAIPLDEALPIAKQIAEALEAAHEQGIIHRDLKPANIKVRGDGVVKVLDFGLAKAATANSGHDVSGAPIGIDSPTMTSAAVTLAGSVLGTAAYMSPEQARGHVVDKRTDIWAFGAILFEMVMGRRLFEGETASDSIAAVLTRDLEPELAAVPATVPAHVRVLLARCLERDSKRRLRDIGEARHQLDQRSKPPAGGPASAPPATSSSALVVPRRRRARLWAGATAGVIVLSAVALLWQHRRQPSSAAPLPAAAQAPSARSIVVLPFVNQSGTDDEYFSDGMTDELASALMKVPGLRVAARSSAFTFKGKSADARDVGAKLGVASVLEGTVRRAGSKLRVTAELVNTTDGLAIWSERYERESKDIFQVQDDITSAIVSALRLTLGTNAAAASHAANAEAHDLYLRGRFLMFKHTEDGLRKGLDYFQQALEKDPNYAPAYAGMAFAWSWLADAYMPPREAEPKAKAAASKALALDPTNAEARTMLAIITWFYDLDVRTADQEFRRVLASSPNSMDAHHLYALTLCSWKRFDEGLAEAARAIDLDPLSPVPSYARATCLWRARRYDDAIEQDKKTRELDPNFYYFESPAGLSYREKGMYAESVREYQHVQQVTGAPVSGLAVTYARMGHVGEARAILQQLLSLAKYRYVSPEQVAMIYANLGEEDEAFAWLERAYEARSAFLAVGVLTSPAYDPLRSDPRFAALLKKMNLEKL